jgi:hypothetical protein
LRPVWESGVIGVQKEEMGELGGNPNLKKLKQTKYNP